jgi:ribonucleoside-diphosphate reductase alpha chain
VLERRYLVHDPQGRPVETPEDMFRRVAGNVAQADRELPFEGLRDPDRTAETFHRMIASLEFLPNSPTLMNAGRDLQQLCACFVLPIEDSMEGIFDALKNAAIIHKTGGGTGFSFSHLRPRNSRVRSTSGIASGPVSFMKVFNAATEAIKQGGMRRGANMGILRVDHPDILEFVDSKRDGGEVTNFNISVAITDDFMAILDREGTFELRAPDGSGAGRLRARDLFDRIVQNAWLCGDPGIVFIDRINAVNPTRHVAPIEATNPCGEQPLSDNEACTLGSLNLSRFLTTDDPPRIDEPRLARAVRDAVHFLDNVIEVTRYPIPEIERVTRANRRIGLGVMGWADLLIALGVPYDSEEALALAGRVMAFIQQVSREASAGLARDRGAFPNFPGSLHEHAGSPPLRNATTTTIAPTGTISLIAGASSGIEPLFAVAYARRNVLDLHEGEAMYEVHPAFLAMARRQGILDEALLADVARLGSVRALPDERVPAGLKRLFATAHDLPAVWHVRMQAAFQAHCDNAVSKTVNLPESATPRDVEDAYLAAWRLGCKGVTVYRHRSRRQQVLDIGAQGERVKTGVGRCHVTLPTGRAPAASSALWRFARPGGHADRDALGRALARMMRPSSLAAADLPVPAPDPAAAMRCPDCGGPVQPEAGCLDCPDCGYSQCQ